MPIRWDKPNKRWRFEFDRYLQDKRHRLSKLLPRGWTQAQADKYDREESARLYAVASGVGELDPLITEAVMLYLTDKTGLKSYKGTSENIMAIAWAYEKKRMSELQAVADEVRAKPEWSPATKKNRLSILKAACRWAWKRHGLTNSDPTTRMQMPEVRNERHVYADRRQMLALARAADRNDVRALIRVAFYTGMRKDELRRAEFSNGALHLDDTKNGSRRSIPVHPRILACMRFVPFTAPKSTLDRAWQRARERVGLKHVHLHDLRHSTASEMINGGVDLFTVGAVLGHKDARSTQRYSHLTHKTLTGAIEKVGQKSPHKALDEANKKATG